MQTLDCKGLKCPEPVLRVKKYLEEHGSNLFSVIVDNEASGKCTSLCKKSGL